MIYILTLPSGFFGRRHFAWQSLDLDGIGRILKERGLAFEVVDYDGLARKHLQANDIIWYSTIAHKEIHLYVVDNLYFWGKRARLVPRFDLLLAYENKGVQELVRRESGLDSLAGQYVFNPEHVTLEKPYVLKSAWGAASKGVFLVKNRSDLQKTVGKAFTSTGLEKIKRLLKSPHVPAAYRDTYRMINGSVGRAVAQRFVSGLTHDWKVLVFGNRYYVLRREVRPNDFRASGSGRFDFGAEPPDGLLDFARTIFTALDSPYISLDIASSDTGFVLLEFQALNFGPTTLTKSPRWFERGSAGSWAEKAGETDLDEMFAYAFVWFYERDSG